MHIKCWQHRLRDGDAIESTEIESVKQFVTKNALQSH